MSLFESIEKVKLNNRQALQEVKDELIQPSERKIEGQKKIVSKAEKQITRVKPGERVKQRNIVKKFFSTSDDPKVSGDSSMRDIEGDPASKKIRQEIEKSTGQKTREFTQKTGVTVGNERLRKDPLDTSVTLPKTKHQKLRAQTTGLQKKYQLKPDSRGMVKPTKAVVLDRLTTNIKKASTPPKPGAKKDAVALQKFNQQIRKSKKYSGNENAKRVEKIVKRIAKNQKIDKTKAGLVQRMKDISYGKNPYKKVFGSANLNLQKRYDKAMLDMGGKTSERLKPYQVKAIEREIAAKAIKKPSKTMTYLAPAGSGKPVPLKTVQQQQQQQPQQGRSRPNPNVSTETQQERARRLRDRVNKGSGSRTTNRHRTRTIYSPSKDELERIKSTLTKNNRKSFGDTLNKSRILTKVPEKEIEKLTKVTQGNKLLNKGFKSGTRGMTKANLFTKLSRRIGTKGKIGLALAGAALAYQALKPKTKTKTKTETPGGGVPIPVNPSNFKMVPASLKLGVKQTKLPSPAINPSTNRQYTDAQGGTSQNKINRFVARSAQAKR